ncbi:hypothetical protein TNCT_579791 [Trichonephila clavata]|uniref:Uncharacterized protein n=1 Tax=Trichonephila clavata TaxID=2740835 RepID=A0A8X6H9B6_TRICU|nr:hypothetical protein TNCT_579791 [Trichonephila clavata]
MTTGHNHYDFSCAVTSTPVDEMLLILRAVSNSSGIIVLRRDSGRNLALSMSNVLGDDRSRVCVFILLEKKKSSTRTSAGEEYLHIFRLTMLSSFAEEELISNLEGTLPFQEIFDHVACYRSKVM